MTKDKIDQVADEMARKAVDEGRLVETGFNALRSIVQRRHGKTEPMVIDSMQLCFFAGAQHVFASIMSVMSKGDEVTPDDERRITSIAEELDRWRLSVQGDSGAGANVDAKPGPMH